MISKAEVSTKKYGVFDAVWIAAALMAMEVYDTKNAADVDIQDFYFKQADIVKRAQQLTDENVDAARVSWWCCADAKKHIYNYLRGDHADYSSARRLTAPFEFAEKTMPEGLDPEDLLLMNGRAITMEELIFFVEEQYPEVTAYKTHQTNKTGKANKADKTDKTGKTNTTDKTNKTQTNIDYISVLRYLEENREVPYSNPEAAGISEEERKRLREVKAKGQSTVAEMKKMVELCKSRFGLGGCETIQWLDGTRVKSRNYLWAQMKYKKFSKRNESISIFVEMSDSIENQARFRVSLEIKNEKSDKDAMKAFHKFLDLPQDVEHKLVYAAGNHELDYPSELKESREEVKAKVEDGTYKKVQICRIIEKMPWSTNESFEAEILAAVAALIPYYEYVLGKKKEELYPSLEVYDPGISAQQYENILSNPEYVKKKWLDTVYYLYKMGGEASCKQIANQYGGGCYQSPHYNVNAVNTAKAVYKATGCEILKRDSGQNSYWPILFMGYNLDDPEEGEYCYVMREPLKEAVKNMEEKGFFANIFHRFDRNMILYGPPGTGKTYQSAIYAVAICDGKSLEELTDYAAVMSRYNELKKEHRIAFTTFHQSYGYEEFIEGIKPVVNQGSSELSYTIEPGIFKKFCEQAKTPENAEAEAGSRDRGKKNPKPYVFIIDEINRGNISKIFGELITLIEDTKREGEKEAASAILPYSHKPFSVPSQVYILGTMNTADRSIALMDTALRRRFQFIEMMPDADVLRRNGADTVTEGDVTVDVAKMLEIMNKRIEYLFDREHTIGHAFFMKLKDDPSVDCLAGIFKKSILPLLQEYFYEDYQKIQLVLGDNEKAEELKFILDEPIEEDIFNGNPFDMVDLPETKYTIQENAFGNIMSYKTIAKNL